MYNDYMIAFFITLIMLLIYFSVIPSKTLYVIFIFYAMYIVNKILVYSNTINGGNMDVSSKLIFAGPRDINIVSTNDELIKSVSELKGYKITYLRKYPEFNTPSFITITDMPPLSEIPSSYIILYNIKNHANTHPRIIKFDDLDKIQNICDSLSRGEMENNIDSITKYNIGEHIFTKIPPNKNTFNYDDSYDIWVNDRDTIIKDSAKKGIPYEKYMTACLSSFIENNSIILDVGTNIGTVSLPLSRLHKSSVKVVSFEPFPDTYSILFKNIIQNHAYNVIPLRMAAGDKNRREISLSNNIVVLPSHIDKEGKSHIVDITKTNDPINFGAVHVGVGDTKSHMTTIDELKLNISAMKVDVEGAEPLVFYGAMNTIERCMPVIVFERNENIVSNEMRKALNLANEAADFSIIEYCYSLGYRDFYELDIHDYMLVPPNRKQIEKNSIAKFKKIKYMKDFSKEIVGKFNLYKFMRPRW